MPTPVPFLPECWRVLETTPVEALVLRRATANIELRVVAKEVRN